MSDEKKIIIIAGPNGAGKTTFATEFLPNEAECPNFINLDLIAAGLSPFAPEKAAIRAGRIMIELMNQYVRRGESFSFETTLSGKGYARLIPQWQSMGYKVKLFFLKLPNPEIAMARVRQRVREGGHNVADDVVRRRFQRGLLNFEKVYERIVNEWAIYDNSGKIPILIDEGARYE
jgi:predicted ABC-type ATPase